MTALKRIFLQGEGYDASWCDTRISEDDDEYILLSEYIRLRRILVEINEVFGACQGIVFQAGDVWANLKDVVQEVKDEKMA